MNWVLSHTPLYGDRHQQTQQHDHRDEHDLFRWSPWPPANRLGASPIGNAGPVEFWDMLPTNGQSDAWLAGR
jgi:hypothetical protein